MLQVLQAANVCRQRLSSYPCHPGFFICRSVQCRPYKYSPVPLNILYTANEDDPRRHLPHLVLNRQGTINKSLLDLGG